MPVLDIQTQRKRLLEFVLPASDSDDDIQIRLHFQGGRWVNQTQDAMKSLVSGRIAW